MQKPLQLQVPTISFSTFSMSHILKHFSLFSVPSEEQN